MDSLSTAGHSLHRSKLPYAHFSRTADRNALAKETLPLGMSASNEEGDSMNSRELLRFQHAHIHAAEVGGPDLSDLLRQLGVGFSVASEGI